MGQACDPSYEERTVYNARADAIHQSSAALAERLSVKDWSAGTGVALKTPCTQQLTGGDWVQIVRSGVRVCR